MTSKTKLSFFVIAFLLLLTTPCNALIKPELTPEIPPPIENEEVVTPTETAPPEPLSAENNLTATQVAALEIEAPMDLAWSPAGEYLAVANANDVSIHDASTLDLLRLIGKGEPMSTVALSPNGDILASGSFNGALILWHAATGEQLSTLSEDLFVISMAFSADGSSLLTGSGGEGTVKLWDVETGQELRNLGAYTRGIGSVAISHNGLYLAWGGEFYESVSLWDLASNTDLEPLYIGPGVTGLAFSPTDNLLAIASGDGNIALWDIASSNLSQSLVVHDDWITINSVAFSPDGTLLASGSEDGSIKLWDVANGEEVGTFSGNTDRVWSMAFSPDGNRLAFTAGDEVILWTIQRGGE